MKAPYWTIAYVIAIVAVNYGFRHVPLIGNWPPMALAVGAVFVLRDFAQREIGHQVALAMVLGGLLSWLMADPFVASASIIAFVVSEGAEYAIYTKLHRSFAARVLVSSLVAAPIDSAIFLSLIGLFSPVGVLAMTASKAIGIGVSYWLLRRR